MNCQKELENADPALVDPTPNVGDSKLSLDGDGASASASSMPNANGEKSIDQGGLLRGGANVQFQNDASSSELSIRSETLTSINGDNLLSTDSECHASPVRNSWENKTRQKSRKRKAKSLTPGCTRDWESNDSWTSEKAQEDCVIAAEEIETKRRKIKSLQQKNRRLKVRHSRLKAAIKEMKANMAEKD